MLLHAVAQLQPCAKEPGLRRCYRNTQLLRHIRHGQFLNIAQQKYIAQQRWDAPDLLVQYRRQFRLPQCLLRRFAYVRKLQRCQIVPDVSVVDIQEFGAPPLAQPH